MGYVLTSLAQTVGVIALAGAGVLVGRRISRLPGRTWILGSIVPLVLAAMIAIARRIPQVEAFPPFTWLMAGRTEFAAMALICITLLTTPLSRLRHRRERWAVAVLMSIFTIYYSILPFFMPALTYGEFSRLKTNQDRDAVCIQSNDYTCGPAAAVTALRKIGVPAQEGDLALWAYTTRFTGTGADCLCDAIRDHYGIPCRTRFFQNVEELRGHEPLIAVVKYGFLVDHFVAVMKVTDTEVIAGDPLFGMHRYTIRQFDDAWRKFAIVLRDSP
jgi:predicted double-glycine peptidase